MAFLPVGVPVMSAAGGSCSGVTRVRSARAFAAALPRTPSELVVVSFVQAGCRACRYASAQYHRIAADATTAQAARFLELDVAAAPDLCRRLGVDNVPQFQLYALPAHCDAAGILDTVVGPRAVSAVRERVLAFAAAELDVDDYDYA